MSDIDREKAVGITDPDGCTQHLAGGTRLSRIGHAWQAVVRAAVVFSVQSPLFGLPHVLTAGFCLWIAWVVSPPLLGFWEGSSYFHTLSPEKIWLSTAIHPRACIGCYDYASMDLSRYLTDIFGLSFRMLRTVPILAGLLSLLLSYRIFRRFSRPVVALGGVLLLASNPVFLIYQHQMLISIVTFAALLFCAEAFLQVDREQPSSVALWAFAAACVFAALHYQLGRYCMLGITLFWLTRGIRLWPRIDLSAWEVRHQDHRRKYMTFGRRFLFILLVLNPINPLLLISPRFLSPNSGEHARSFAEALHSIFVNSPLILKSFLGGDRFFGPHATDIINSVPFPSINLPLLVLGVIGCLAIARRVGSDRSVFLIAFLLFLTAVPISLSSIFPSVLTTLSPFRLFYILVPTFILICVGMERLTSIGEIALHRLLGERGRRAVVWLGAIAICVGVGFQTRAVLVEQERFRGFVEEMPCGESAATSREFGCHSELQARIAGPGDPLTPFEWAHNTYQTDQIPAYRYSGLMGDFIRENLSSGKPLVVEVPISELSAGANSHFARHNTKKWMIALYLADQDLDVRIAVPYPGEKALSATQELAGFLISRFATANNYRGKFVSRLTNYPLAFDGGAGRYILEEVDPFWSKILRIVNERGWTRVRDALIGVDLASETPLDLNERFHFTIRRFGRDGPPVFLTTTQGELDFVMTELRNEPHHHVRFSHNADPL